MLRAAEPWVVSDPDDEGIETEMSQAALKTTSVPVKKRRSPLSTAERASLPQIKANPTPVTPRARKAAADFSAFRKANPGW